MSEEVKNIYDIINPLSKKVREEETNRFISVKNNPAFIVKFVSDSTFEYPPFKKFMYAGNNETVYYYSPPLEKYYKSY